MTRLAPPNFVGDWFAILRGALARLEFEGAHDRTVVPDEKVDIVYFACVARLVPQRPRAVHLASSLVVLPEVRAGFDAVCKLIAAGGDLQPHLSKLTRDALFKDGLLNDWGIHHLHLGTSLEANGFATRTKQVLFVRFDGDRAHLIAIMDHQRWGETQLLEIVLHDWPDLLANCELPGLFGGRDRVSSTDIMQARRAGVQPLVTLSNGKVYGPMGGGLATDGTSVRAVDTADRWRLRISELQDRVVEDFPSFCARVEAAGATLPDEVHLKFAFEPSGAHALVEGTNIKWLLEPA